MEVRNVSSEAELESSKQQVVLDSHERYLLLRGISEWSGSASCSEEMAVALGFSSVADLQREGERIAALLESELPLSSWDWTRALLSTELVFSSVVMGSGSEWQTVFGLDDVDTLRLLRSVQRKLRHLLVKVGHIVYSK